MFCADAFKIVQTLQQPPDLVVFRWYLIVNGHTCGIFLSPSFHSARSATVVCSSAHRKVNRDSTHGNIAGGRGAGHRSYKSLPTWLGEEVRKIASSSSFPRQTMCARGSFAQSIDGSTRRIDCSHCRSVCKASSGHHYFHPFQKEKPVSVWQNCLPR